MQLVAPSKKIEDFFKSYFTRIKVISNSDKLCKVIHPLPEFVQFVIYNITIYREGEQYTWCPPVL